MPACSRCGTVQASGELRRHRALVGPVCKDRVSCIRRVRRLLAFIALARLWSNEDDRQEVA